MMLPLAREFASSGIRVCTIGNLLFFLFGNSPQDCLLAPGTFATPLLAGLPEPARIKLAAAVKKPLRWLFDF
jgi:hypothetical protein